MAFVLSELACVDYSGAGTNGHRRWVYENTAGDSTTTVKASGYFNGANHMIETGDLVTDAANADVYSLTKNASTGVITAAGINGTSPT